MCGQGNQGTADTVLPPRNIPFQFSSTQGYVIEAGNAYFRLIQNGAYITEAPIAISGVTTDSPAVVTTSAPHGYSTSNEIFLTGVVGPIGLDGRSFLITVIDATHFSLINPLDGRPASSLGMPALRLWRVAPRIYDRHAILHRRCAASEVRSVGGYDEHCPSELCTIRTNSHQLGQLDAYPDSVRNVHASAAIVRYECDRWRNGRASPNHLVSRLRDGSSTVYRPRVRGIADCVC